jgi:hypothetical protein
VREAAVKTITVNFEDAHRSALDHIEQANADLDHLVERLKQLGLPT